LTSGSNNFSDFPFGQHL